jgi:3-polyprenyl-4-hydroxybenzoate decarboxylase
MQTATPTRQRTLRLTRTAAGSLALVITEQKGGRAQVDAYYLSAVAGGAWRFSKHDCTVYTVTPSTCTCPGHVNHGRKGTVCRHRAALVALKERGKL